MNPLRKLLLLASLLASPVLWAAQFNPFVSGPYDDDEELYDVIVDNVEVINLTSGKSGDVELIFDEDGTPISVDISAAISTDPSGNSGDQWVQVTGGPNGTVGFSGGSVSISFELADFDSVDEYKLTVEGIDDAGGVAASNIASFTVTLGCNDCGCPVAGVKGVNACVHLEFNLGEGQNGNDALGSLKLIELEKTPDIYDPAALQLEVSDQFEVITDPNISGGSYLKVFQGFENTGSNVAAPVSDEEALQNAGQLDFTISSMVAGDYNLWMRTRVSDDQSESLWLTIDSQEAVRVVRPLESSDWQWSLVTNPLALAAGAHDLSFAFRESGLQLDRLLLADDLTFIPLAENDLPASGNHYLLEAESATVAAPFVTISDANLASGAYVDVVAEPLLSEIGSGAYTLTIPDLDSGNYTVWGKVFAQYSHSDSVLLSLQGGASTLWQWTASEQSDWERAPVNLTQAATGDASLSLNFRESGFSIDSFLVIAQSDFNSVDSGHLEFDAEDATLSGNASIVVTDDPFAESNGAYLDGLTGSADYSLSVSSGHAGNYRMYVRARTGATSPQLSVDMGLAGSVIWTLPTITDWTWVELTTQSFALVEGAQSLSLDFQSGQLEIDRIVLTSDLSFTPSGLEVDIVQLEAETGDAATPFEITSIGVEVVEQSLRNTETKPTGFARVLLPESLPVDSYYLWVRSPLSLSSPSSLWVNWNQEDEIWSMEYDVSIHGAQTEDQDWIWHRYSVAIESDETARVLLKWRERGTRIDSMLLTADGAFNPNSLALGSVSGDVAVSLYQEAEQAGQSDLPWKSYHSIKQILAGTALLNINSHSNGLGYDLDFYPASFATTKTDGAYDLPAISERITFYEVTDPTGDGGQLDLRKDGTLRYSYIWSDAARDWKLSHAGGLKIEDAETTWNANKTIETRTMTVGRDTNSDGEIDITSSKTVEIYQHVAGQRYLLSRTVDPDGRALVSTYSYTPEPLPDSGQPRSGLLMSMQDPNGYWEIHDYNGDDLKTKTVSQYINSTFGDEANSRVVTYDYEIPGDVSAALPNIEYYEMRVTTVMGVETSRTYQITQKPGSSAAATFWNITAVNAGAAWNAEGNRVSVRERLANYRDASNKRGYMTGSAANIEVEHLTLYSYEEDVADFSGALSRKTTMLSGEPNALATAIIDGNRTITWQRNATNVESQQENYRIIAEGSYELIGSWLASEVDTFNRVTETTYYDESGAFLYTTSKVYNCCGLESETDQYGIATYYEYDGMDRRITSTRLGVTTEMVYDADSRVIATKRYPEGQSAAAVTLSTATYGLDGEMLTQSNLVASDTEIYATTSYASEILTGTDALGDLVAIGERRTVTYDDGGVAINESAADGNLLYQYGSAVDAERVTYDKVGTALTTRRIPMSYNVGASAPADTTNYTDTSEWIESHTEMGRSVKMLFADGSFSENFYDLKGRPIKTIDPDGITTLYAYNAEGERYRTAIDIDQNGLIDTSIDRVTESEREVATREGQTVERSATFVWSDSSRVQTSMDDRSLDGRESWSESFGQISYSVQSVPASGSWTVTSTQPDGSYSVQTYTGGRMSGSVSYDSADVQLASTTILYDALGRQEYLTDSRTGTTQMTYYDNDAVASVISPDPDGAGPLTVLETSYIYDTMGEQIQTILPDATSSFIAYNLKGEIVKTYGTQQNPVEYTYDYAGRQKTMTTWQDFDEVNGVGISGAAVTTWNYNPQRGWLDRKEYDDGNGTDYSYTAGGRLATRSWARGVDTNYAYNSAGDLLAVDYDDAGFTPDIHYTYTSTGQQDIISEGQYAASAFTAGAILTPSLSPALATTDRSTAYAHNSRFQVETETFSGLLSSNAVLTRSYEDGTETNGLIGRSKGFSLSASSAISAVNYAYDSSGRLQTITDGTDTFTYGYVPNTVNLLASMTGPVHTATYSYELGRNAMTGIENKETVGTASVVSNYAYTYNALGQRADREQSGAAFAATNKDTFTYDYLGQVTASSNDSLVGNAYNPSYAYDEIGNRTGNATDLNGTIGYTQNLLNQYTELSTSGSPVSTPSYDADGNLLSDSVWTYTWNGENRLINATDGSTSIDFLYDYQGRLIEKHDGTTVEVYLHDGWNRIATYQSVSNSPFTLHSSYTWGLDLSGSMQGAGGVGGLLKEGSLYPTYDANGNIVQKLNASGVALMSVEYDPFGNIVSGTLVGEYAFSTKPLIENLDWYYYGFRYYDPVTGRWPSRDPIEEEGGLNLYLFLDNDGVNRSDFFGLVDWTTKSTDHRYDLGAMGDAISGETYPGGGTWSDPVGNRILAVTVAEWDVDTKCVCKSGKWVLNYVKVDFTPVVRYRSSYSSNRMSRWVRVKEQDHVADYKWWARNVGKPLVAKFEKDHLGDVFVDEATCESDLNPKVESEMQTSFLAAVQKTIADWDDTGKHTYPYNN